MSSEYLDRAKEAADEAGGGFRAGVFTAIAQTEAAERMAEMMERNIGLKLERLVLATNTIESYLCRTDEKLERQADALQSLVLVLTTHYGMIERITVSLDNIATSLAFMDRIDDSLGKLAGCVHQGKNGEQVLTVSDNYQEWRSNL